MAYDIKLVKLVNGEMVVGKFDEENNALNDVAVLQSVPTQQGVQMMLMPYGFPFEEEMKGSISLEHVIYTYEKFPEDLKTKYLEASSNLTLSAPGNLSNLNLKGGGGNVSGIGDLFKK